MKNKILLIIMIILLFSISVNAEIVTIYQSVDPVEIKTAAGMATTIEFPVEIKRHILGSTTAFSVEIDNEFKDILVVSAIMTGVTTNLTVYDVNDERYVFRLIEDNDIKNFYDLVIVKQKESLPYSDIVRIINNERYHVKQELIELVDLFDIEKCSLENGEIKVNIKRCGIINNTDETVYWINIENVSDKEIIINTIGVKEREMKKVITQAENIIKGNSNDYYLIARGRTTDKTLTLNITSNNKINTFVFKEIPYKTQNFKVYEINSF